MAATRLDDSQKQELVERYCAGESTSELAGAFGCSVHTVGRVVRAALTPEEHERLKQQRARSGRSGGLAGTIPAAAPEPASPEEPPSPAEPASPVMKLGPAEEGEDSTEAVVPTVATLAIDDADDFGDDGTDDDSNEPGEDLGDGNQTESVTGSVSLDPVHCLPLAEAQLPGSVYMLVDKLVELDARPLSSFTDLGLLPPEEEERQALQVFVNPRNAKRLCGRSQRVIKIPDTRIFERTAPYLLAQGISRVVIENGLYSLPGA
jgi:transposase-like protein